MIMGKGLLDFEFISLKNLLIDYRMRTGNKLNKSKLFYLFLDDKINIYLHLNYSSKAVFFTSKNKLLDYKKNLSIDFSSTDSSGTSIVTYNADWKFRGIEPKKSTDSDKKYFCKFFNLVGIIKYTQQVEGEFLNIDCEHINLKEILEFSDFFHLKLTKNFRSYFFSSYYDTLLGTQISEYDVDDYAYDGNTAYIQITDINLSLPDLLKEIERDDIYFLKRDIEEIYQYYEELDIKKSEKIELLSEYRFINKVENIAQDNSFKNNEEEFKKTEPIVASNELGTQKEETYKQIIKGLICLANPNFEYPLKRKKMLKADNSYNCNAIADKIVSVTEKLRNEGKIINNTRGNTTIRTHINDIIKELNQK